MKAWVIKTKKGYLSRWGDDGRLNEANLFLTRAKARERSFEGEKVVRVNIEVVKDKK